MIRLLILAMLSLQASVAGAPAVEEENKMAETLRNFIHHNSLIADICVYEQEWIPPTEALPKGQLVRRAVITNVHSGSWKVGQRIEYTHFIEDSPGFLKRFRSTVPGELKTFFFNPDGSEVIEDGMLKIRGDGHWGFHRLNDPFADLFAQELKTNPKLKAKPGHGAQ